MSRKWPDKLRKQLLEKLFEDSIVIVKGYGIASCENV